MAEQQREVMVFAVNREGVRCVATSHTWPRLVSWVAGLGGWSRLHPSIHPKDQGKFRVVLTGATVQELSSNLLEVLRRMPEVEREILSFIDSLRMACDQGGPLIIEHVSFNEAGEWDIHPATLDYIRTNMECERPIPDSDCFSA